MTTSFNDIQKTTTQMQEEFQKITAEFQSKMQLMFTDMTKSFFEAAPEIKAVIWSQYTPYFNDGEECVFSVNEINFLTKAPESVPHSVYDLEEDEDEDYEVFYKDATQDNLEYYKDCISRYPNSSSYYHNKVHSIEKALENPRHGEISKLCEGLESVIDNNEDLMKAIFGDHVVVMLTPDGSETNGCNHD